MRYFKYPHKKKTDKETYKAELAAFDERGKRLARKEKLFGILAVAVFTVVMIASVILLDLFFVD